MVDPQIYVAMFSFQEYLPRLDSSDYLRIKWRIIESRPNEVYFRCYLHKKHITMSTLRYLIPTVKVEELPSEHLTFKYRKDFYPNNILKLSIDEKEETITFESRTQLIHMLLLKEFKYLFD
jgi:hypothetical protein